MKFSGSHPRQSSLLLDAHPQIGQADAPCGHQLGLYTKATPHKNVRRSRTPLLRVGVRWLRRALRRGACGNSKRMKDRMRYARVAGIRSRLYFRLAAIDARQNSRDRESSRSFPLDMYRTTDRCPWKVRYKLSRSVVLSCRCEL